MKTLSTPPGRPASSRIWASAYIDSGVCCAGLTTIVQPAATAGPIFRVPIAIGKFHGVIIRQGPIGCFIVQTRPCAGLIGRPAAVDPHGLLGVPAEELVGVGDLGLRLGDGLAHLERHQQRELVGALASSARRRGAGSPRARAAGGRPTRPASRPRRRARPSRRRAWRRRPRQTPRRSRGPPPRGRRPAGVAPLAADEEALLDGVDDLLFVGGGERAHAQEATQAHGSGRGGR